MRDPATSEAIGFVVRRAIGDCFEIGGMEADHITPWSQGGKTNAANC